MTREPARPWHLYAVAAALGIATYLVVFGFSHFVGTSPYWELPVTDERVYLMGYRYFLHEPWHWPVFVSQTINVPRPTSVAFWDVIPIWALFNKTVATLVPPWRSFSAHAYLGMWHALTYALQACLAVAVLRALGHRSWRAGIATAMFLLAVPSWIYRGSHDALSAHWLELWAIYLYLRTPARAPFPRKLGVAWISQLTLAALIHPYHPVMSMGILAASLARSRDVRTLARWLPLVLVAIGAATWFAGYFARETARPQWGFEYESTNALSWLVPLRSGIIGDGRWIANVMATSWQYEGYAYLGLGYLVLLALFIPHVRTLRDVIRRHVFLFAVALGFWLLALSNHIYVGGHEVASYPIPSVLAWIPHQFRSPGRFVWVPMYVLIVFVLHWAFTRFSGRRFAIVVVAAVLQLVDARGDWAAERETTRAPQWRVLDLDGWRHLIHAHQAVFVHPTYACVDVDERVDRLNELATEIQLLTSERALPINGTYNARVVRKCNVEQQEWPELPLVPDTLYVLLPKANAIADRFQAAGAHCGTFDDGRVCSTNEAAIGEAIRAGVLRPPPPPIVLSYRQKLDVAALPSFEANWSPPESGGRWTDNVLASVLLHLEGDPPSGVALKLLATTRVCGDRTAQDVDVFLDDRALTTLHFDAGSNDPGVVRTIAIPDRDRLRRAALTLQFRPHDVRSPAALGCGSDARRLGLFVSQLWFE